MSHLETVTGRLGLSLIAILLLCGGARVASALPHPGHPQPTLPPVHPDPKIAYYGNDVHALYPQGVILKNPIHRNFTNIQRTPIGSDEREDFNSVLDALVDVPGMGIFNAPITLTGPVTTIARNYTSGQTGTIDVEIVSMSLTGSVGGVPVIVRESPVEPSLGETTIVDQGGGLYQIDSFFDVFTELSIDGGQSWGADQNGPARMEYCPEPASIMLLGIGALLITRRRGVA